jgi:hypothetical protein
MGASRTRKRAPGRGWETGLEGLEVCAWCDVGGRPVGGGHHFDEVVAVRHEVEGPRGRDGREGEVFGLGHAW